MKKTKRYEIEGTAIDISLRYDESVGMYIEEYPDFAAEPLFTTAGHQIMFACEDACIFAEEAEEGGCPDCSCCKHYLPAGERTLLGICKNPFMMKSQ